MPQGWTPVAAPSGWTPVPEAAPDFRATNSPPSLALRAAAAGKNLGVAALDALPGAGALLGGAIATPESVGLATIPGAAVGAGIGRGLRDLIAEGFGLERPTSPASKGGRIGVDTADTAVASVAMSILPGLWAGIKTPGKTVAELVDTLPERLLGTDIRQMIKKMLPPGLGKAPATVLERPAWQAWSDHLPQAPARPPPGTTGTSMQPGPMPAAPPPNSAPNLPPPLSAPPPPPQGPIAAAQAARLAQPLPVAPVPPPVATPAAVDEFTAARTARANALPDQRALNDQALAARRAAYQASQGGPPPGPAAVPEPPPTPSPPTGPVVKESGQMKLTAPEWTEFQRLLKRKIPAADALTAVQQMRELAARLGGATPAEVAKAVAQRDATGKW